MIIDIYTFFKVVIVYRYFSSVASPCLDAEIPFSPLPRGTTDETDQDVLRGGQNSDRSQSRKEGWQKPRGLPLSLRPSLPSL